MPIPSANPPKLYKTGDVLKRSGISRQMLHNYLQMGLIEEYTRSQGGHRLFVESVFARLKLIQELNRTGYSLRDLRETFRPFRHP